MDQITDLVESNASDTRTAQDDTAYPDQASDLGEGFYWTEVSR